MPTWLVPQNYDIYVPSMKIAFEYQGIQHYKPVEFFGGEKAYLKRVELDNKKKARSEQQGVNLIYWEYNEPITKVILRKKLREININI